MTRRGPGGRTPSSVRAQAPGASASEPIAPRARRRVITVVSHSGPGAPSQRQKDERRGQNPGFTVSASEPGRSQAVFVWIRRPLPPRPLLNGVPGSRREPPMRPRKHPGDPKSPIWQGLGRCRPYPPPYARPIALVVLITVLASGLPALEPLGFRAI